MKVLIIRRDNIGDLICTTPLFEAIRRQYPEAYIAALVNSYNAPAIQGNPHLDAIFAYTKGKHADGETVLGALPEVIAYCAGAAASRKKTDGS